jgi:hypothetical protein
MEGRYRREGGRGKEMEGMGRRGRVGREGWEVRPVHKS